MRNSPGAVNGREGRETWLMRDAADGEVRTGQLQNIGWGLGRTGLLRRSLGEEEDVRTMIFLKFSSYIKIIIFKSPYTLKNDGFFFL